MSTMKTTRQETAQTLYRQMAWLVTPHYVTEQVITRHGLTGSSPDVTEMEHQRSHTVLQGVLPILGDLSIAAKVATDVVTDLRLVSHDVDEESSVEEHEYLQAVIMQTTLSIIAFLLDIGSLKVGDHRMVGIE